LISHARQPAAGARSCRWGLEASAARAAPERAVGLTPPRLTKWHREAPMASPALTLRPLQAADCDHLLSWIDSEDAMYQWSGARGFTWPLDRGQLLRDLAAHAGSSRELLAAVDGGGEMVGHVSVDTSQHHRLANIGRVAVAPDRRGHGLGTALMRATIRHGFDDLGLHRLQLTVYTFNTAALACYRGVGFIVEGMARDSTRGSAGYWDALTMSLLESDYRRPLVLGEGVRIAHPRDAESVAALLTELGHPHARDEAAARLLAWAAEPHATVLVAEADGGVAGCIAVGLLPSFERPGRSAQVAALAAPGPEVRHRLLDAARRWAAHRAGADVEISPPGDPGA
jgi:RimJ/RimL family protein N-acetyltransferase